MKKIFLILSLVGLFSLTTTAAFAQADMYNPEIQIEGGEALHQVIKNKFIEGGAMWMAPLLLCLVLGLAIVIERVLYLNLSTVNTKKLLDKVVEALNTEGLDAAKEICRDTRGPVATMFYQGLERYNEGLDAVEKNLVATGSVQNGMIEGGLSWVGLFIAISPMIGFMGTIVGMIMAFDSIEAAGDISPTVVAGGIKVALLTTFAALTVAITLQLCYNYLISKIDSLTIDMEDSSISFMDVLTEYSRKK